MNPIISPLWFYLIGIVENLGNAFIIGGSMLIGIPILLIIFEVIKTFKSAFKVIILGIVLLFLSIFVPTKETAYQMLATSLITPNNITIVTDGAKNLVDYIINVADGLTDADALSPKESE